MLKCVGAVAATAVFSGFADVARPDADPAATVTCGNARFTVLTDRLLRMEYSPDRSFEDRATLTFVNRRLPVPEFTVEGDPAASGKCVIRTKALTLSYQGGPFSADTLSIESPEFSWHFGDADVGNLYGTTRTLDTVRGFDTLMPRMEKGLVSRSGWAVVDDSVNHCLIPSGDHWGEWAVTQDDVTYDDDLKNVSVYKIDRKNLSASSAKDLYFFGYGHDYRGCLADYVKVAGRIPLPPRWAFGFWWSRYWLYTDGEIRALIDEMISVGMPIDVFIIDMEWHETWNIGDRPDLLDEFGQRYGWTGYTWNRRLFPNPKSTLDYLHANGCKVALNLHPASGIQPFEECYPAFCADYGWQGTNAVPIRIGEPKWCDSYFRAVLGPLERMGVDFWWIDWQQWIAVRGIPGLSNTFWLNHLFSHHMKERNGGIERPMIYHRWGGLGSHRYQVGFSGDSKVAWSMLSAIPWFTATASNVGYGYWGHDIGGHHEADGTMGTDGELFTRWLQSGVFNPIFKIHSTKDARIERRIWKYPEHFDILRDALRLRYRLAPYIYTAARATYDTGVGICRPMYYDSPESDEAYAVRNAYMFGDDILAVTVTNAMDKAKGVSEVRVWLPEGRWYDTANGELLEGGRTVDRVYTIAQNPWFAKAGAIIPMYPKSVRNLAKVGTDDLEFLFVPGTEKGSCEVYEDDGTNPDYDVRCRRTRIVREGGRIVIGPRRGAYTLRFPCSAPPKSVTVDGRDCPWSFDADDFAVVIRTPVSDGSREMVAELEMPADAQRIAERLNGLKGETLRLAPLSEALKTSLKVIDWAINLPDSYQTFWQTPAAMMAEPNRIGELLDRREAARRQFAEDLKRYAPKLSKDVLHQLEEMVNKCYNTL